MINCAKNLLRKKPTLVICLAQLLATSIWFSANGVMNGLELYLGATSSNIGWLTIAVQVGFIAGALVISITGVADKFSPTKIFIVSALFGALFNLLFALATSSFSSAIAWRFLVGLSLGGVYPIGMKMIVCWAPEDAGASLGYLVGMLTLGTALPHGLRSINYAGSWSDVVAVSSFLAIVGALLISLLGEPPNYYNNKKNLFHRNKIRMGAVLEAFKYPGYRSAAIGYFGHMWELYAFWAIVPIYVGYIGQSGIAWLNQSFIAFLVIGAGAIGSILGGVISKTVGSAMVAFSSLALSFLCCSIFVIWAADLPPHMLFILLIFWGGMVVADSPQFSALSAKTCPPDLVGSALAIQNAIGFGVTLISIALVTGAVDSLGARSAVYLIPGPLIGLIYFGLKSARCMKLKH